MAVTPASFKVAKPQFASVDNATVQTYLDMAARMVDSGWTDGDRDNAQIAFACHLMTLDGLGTDSESTAHRSGAAEYQSIRSGQLTLTRFRSTTSDMTDLMGWLSQTVCGRYYALLLRLNKTAALTVSVAQCPPVSPYAKDWPR